MLGNCEKMKVISSNTKEWPQVQNQIDEQKKLMASTGRVMEKPNQDQQQQQQPLNCPRCDSTNTKFCYYNNYSLSQPRHFCKACKRYWTRGGTLRNVPVGGGCRKNKRVKRPASAGDVTSSSALTVTTNPSAQVQTQIDLPSNSNNHMNPLFYSLPSNHIEPNLPYSSTYANTVSGFNLQPQINALGLGFQSGLFVNNIHSNDYKNGFNFSKQIQDVITPSSSNLPSNPIFGSPTFASTFQQPKFINSSGLKNHSQAFADNLQGLDNWNISSQNQVEQMNSSDPSLLWNTTGVGAWLDPSYMGSSVSSLM